MQVAEYRFNDTRAFLLPKPLKVGRVSVWPWVRTVFAVSFVFQAFNIWDADVASDDSDDGDDADANDGEGDRDGEDDGGKHHARGPDYARWVEYALTSLFQVFAVATLFYAEERNLLVCIMFLQGMLVLMGFGIELELRNTIVDIRSGRESRAARRLWRALGLACLAVAAHCAVWGVLVWMFQNLVQNVSNCYEDNNMPIRLISTLLGGQCFLFSLFGVVAIYQLCWLAWCVYSHECARIREELFSRDFWLQGTIIYCGLSCVVKTSLAIPIVSVQVAMPRQQR